MKRNKDYTCALGCPVEATLDLVGGKWKGVILYHLVKDGTLRFNELMRRLNGATQRIVTKQLRELEHCELITRTVYAQVPPRVEYRLSSKGESLKPVIRALEVWGENHLVEQSHRVKKTAPRN